MPLSRMVTVAQGGYPSANVERDTIDKMPGYLPGGSTVEVVERLASGLAGAKGGRVLSVTGPYGSGKSSMATLLKGLLAPGNSAEWSAARRILASESPGAAVMVMRARRAHSHADGMIRCAVTARREPVAVTVIRALDAGASGYFGKRYSRRDFGEAPALRRCMREAGGGGAPSSDEVIRVVSSMCAEAPVVIMIDEFGKNIECFASGGDGGGDLFLLQELAEMSGRGGMPLGMMTLQHMAFEEHAADASVPQRREWAKIQGRFEDIPFANSPDQTRRLVAGAMRPGQDAAARAAVARWAGSESAAAGRLGIGSGLDEPLVASCYPLGPLALEVLPELCSRYGQHERTLFSFISGAGRHTVASFIDKGSHAGGALPSMGLDALYDHFISGASAGRPHAATGRLAEIETIIRDSHGLGEHEAAVLKTIGVLNLVGRSGHLRASREVIGHATGTDPGAALEVLESRSIVTYRRHADEYRIWHGTDVDIAQKFDSYRRRHRALPLPGLLGAVLRPDPIVAARHGMETGTMRLFGRRFSGNAAAEEGESRDGTVVYMTGDHAVPEHGRPVITVRPAGTVGLQDAASEVAALRDILGNDEEVRSDWVARRELEERLADAEVVLETEFEAAYGGAARWAHVRGGSEAELRGTPGSMVSDVCDREYGQSPQVRNEMINRDSLSTQGAAARRRLIASMITDGARERLGIEGWGPDRAVYEAVLQEGGIHVADGAGGWRLTDPKGSSIRPVWKALLQAVRGAKGRVELCNLYTKCRLPPFGVKDGVAPILVIALVLAHRDNIALYEHGTYVPRLTPEVTERMEKNPEYYEIKYFKGTRVKSVLLRATASRLGVKSEGSVLDVVGHMVRVVSSLPPHIKKTKRLDKRTLAVRDAVLAAVEPDTLLFESLPEVLGFKAFYTRAPPADIARFSKCLAKSISTLQGGFAKVLSEIGTLLFEATGIEDRAKLSRIASKMQEGVSDQKMKVFLGALSADVLERDEDWVKYVAMSLTDIPPANWTDDQRKMFENNLVEISNKFRRLASVYFSKVGNSFTKSTYCVTITNAKGGERYDIVSLKPHQEELIEGIVDNIATEMKKHGLGEGDVGALVAALLARRKGA